MLAITIEDIKPFQDIIYANQHYKIIHIDESNKTPKLTLVSVKEVNPTPIICPLNSRYLKQIKEENV